MNMYVWMYVCMCVLYIYVLNNRTDEYINVLDILIQYFNVSATGVNMTIEAILEIYCALKSI